MQPFTFQKAKPVWLAGRRQEMNLSVVLKATVPQGLARLCVAGHSDYEIIVNGHCVLKQVTTLADLQKTRHFCQKIYRRLVHFPLAHL